ncbi:MAG: polyhydroxyalkanoic acid system family protein [Puia sp.]
MIVKVKHELSRQMAQDRIKQLLETAVKEHAGLISTHDFIWNGNSCDILLSAMKMQFKGNVVLNKDNVQVDVRVPLIFYGYQSKIKTVIEDELNKILK